MARQFMLHFALAFLSTPFNCKEKYLFHDLYPALSLGECLYGRVELNLVGLGEQLYYGEKEGRRGKLMLKITTVNCIVSPALNIFPTWNMENRIA